MDKKDYIEISKASDLKSTKDRILYRALEILPGVISLGTLFGVLIFSWLLPSWVAIFMIVFCFFYLLRVLYFSIHNIFGYIKVKNHTKKNWLLELEKMKWQNIYHLVIKNNKMYVSDGNLEIKIEEGALKNIFTPINDVLWADVEFSEVKTNKK